MPANDLGNNKFDPFPFYRSDWKETVAAMQPGGGDTFGIDESDTVLVGYVPWEKRFSFVFNVLGYSYVQTVPGVAGGRLRRVLPLFHPWYEWMAAYQVHIQARRPGGRYLKWNAPDPFLEFDFAGYQDINCLIRFRQQPWEYKYDSLGLQEYERYVYEMNSSGELTVLSQIQLDSSKQPRFAEGPAGHPGPQAPGGNDGVPYPGEFPFYAYKENLPLRWMQVPKDFVCLPNTFKKPKIAACVGRVNLTSFLGFQPGELLLNPPTYERFQWPVRVVGLPGFNLSAYGYNITLPFSSFSPTKGVTASNFFGHNLLPFQEDGLWYLATRGGSTGDPKMIPAAEFANIFLHAATP